MKRNPDEVHTCWPPLTIILRDGVEGYPPATAREPYQKPSYFIPKTDRRVLREWGEIA